jgi:hypothetical protein
MGVLDALGKMIEFLIGEMYRAAHIRFEMDSLQAESAEAIRLQHTELNEMLANLAAELPARRARARPVLVLLDVPGRGRRGIDHEFDAAVVIAYPREFFIADLLEELQKWANAIKLDLGSTFEHYAKRRVVDQLAPESGPGTGDCRGKVQHWTHEDARRHLETLTWKRDEHQRRAARLNVYQCKWCHAFHVGHRRGKVRRFAAA